MALLSGCATSPEMRTDEPVADIAHSGKAIVITSSLEDTHGVLGHLTQETLDTFVDQDFRTAGPDGILRNSFTVGWRTNAYLVEPGSYFLARIYRPTARTSLNFDQAESPVRFSVAPGDVLYLGELHIERTVNPNNPACGVAVTLEAADVWDAERGDVERTLDAKYPGAKGLVRKSPPSIPAETLKMARVGGC